MNTASQMEVLKERLSASLCKSGELDSSSIPESRKMMSMMDLEGSPVRIRNMIVRHLGVDAIWDFVHVQPDKVCQCRCFTNSCARMSELVSAIDEAILTLAGDTIASK